LNPLPAPLKIHAPRRGSKAKLSSRTKSKSTFDQLNRSFNADVLPDCDQDMKVVWHDYEIVQEILPCKRY
jgi:hypothetical protein